MQIFNLDEHQQELLQKLHDTGFGINIPGQHDIIEINTFSRNSCGTVLLGLESSEFVSGFKVMNDMIRPTFNDWIGLRNYMIRSTMGGTMLNDDGLDVKTTLQNYIEWSECGLTEDTQHSLVSTGVVDAFEGDEILCTVDEIKRHLNTRGEFNVFVLQCPFLDNQGLVSTVAYVAVNCDGKIVHSHTSSGPGWLTTDLLCIDNRNAWKKKGFNKVIFCKEIITDLGEYDQQNYLKDTENEDIN